MVMTLTKKLENGTITTPKGFHASGLHAGIKKKKLDLGAIYCEVPASCAAVYTLNKVQAAPIKITKEAIQTEGHLQALIVNSGNANACTGIQGEKDAKEMQQLAAEHFSISPHFVAVASTGVIGEWMPMEKIRAGIPHLHVSNKCEEAKKFTQAILTTDTIEKTTCYQFEIDGQMVTISGVAKGSGMIHPNMATMLAFITTDAVIDSDDLSEVLKQATNDTFNCITVDGETSTNDMVLVMASGLAKHNKLTKAHSEYQVFKDAFKHVAEDLAKMIARDGEGATKLIEVTVEGAKNDEEAGIVAKKIAGSDLVKSAVYGKDANWGRIICAVGHSEQTIDPNQIDIKMGPIEMLRHSQPVPFSEDEALAYFENEKIEITVNLNIGNGKKKAWGCDLTYDYVRINASYRT